MEMRRVIEVFGGIRRRAKCIKDSQIALDQDFRIHF